jgi:MFS family permease
MVFVTGLSIMTGSTPKEKTGYIFGYLHVIVATGLILGPLCGGIIHHYAGYHAAFGVVFLLLAINLILCSAIIDRLTGENWSNAPEIGHDPDVEDSEAPAYGSNGTTDASTETLKLWYLIREPRMMISATSILAYFLVIAALLNVSSHHVTCLRIC